MKAINKDKLLTIILFIVLLILIATDFFSSTFVKLDDFASEETLLEIFSYSEPLKINSVHMSESVDQQFVYIGGHLSNEAEQSAYITIYKKLPFFNCYTLEWQNIYDRSLETSGNSNHIITINNGTVDSMLWQYDLEIYSTHIEVGQSVNYWNIIMAGLIILLVYNIQKRISKY